METNKKHITEASEPQKKKSSPFLKTNFIGVSFSVLFALAIFLLVMEQINKPKNTFIPPKTKISLPASFPSDEKMALSNRLTSLENQLKEIQIKLQQTPKEMPRKLIGVDLISAVLNTQIPLETLKKFLQSTPEPWATTLLTSLGSAKDIKTYTQLEQLVVHSPITKLLLWGRIKRKLQSFIHIRKLDKDGNYEVAEFEDIRKALENHDLKKALDLYNKLSPEEKLSLAAWKEAASVRFSLEEMSIKLLSELAGS